MNDACQPPGVGLSEGPGFETALFVQNYLSFSARKKTQFARALRTEMAAIPRPWPFQKAVAADRFSPSLLKHDL
jgi:hypothetical protein